MFIVLKLNVAKLLNLLNIKDNPWIPCATVAATLYQDPHDLITNQFVDKDNKTMLLNAY